MNTLAKLTIALGLGCTIALALSAGTDIATQSYSVNTNVKRDTIERHQFTVADYAVYEITVAHKGHQAALDLCAGPVLTDFGTYGQSIAEHNHCGGAYVHALKAGDQVIITGYNEGSYTVVGSKDVPQRATADVLDGKLWLQTCYFNSNTMRLVELEAN